MKKLTGFLFLCFCSPLAQAGVLFEITPDGIVPAAQVEDSVFWYQADEQDSGVATVDHWETVCFQSDALDAVCPAFKHLFETSRDQLMQSGAEEDVELLSCSTNSGIPVLTYNLVSYHGGSNILQNDKKIPACPSLSK